MAEDGESGFVKPSVYNPYQSQTIQLQLKRLTVDRYDAWTVNTHFSH